NIPGLLTLSGDNATANATMPFSVVIGGTSYSTITISTNGWIEFGGNTQGTSDPANAALPTSKHTNPFLAAYWDDLDTFGDNIRPNEGWSIEAGRADLGLATMTALMASTPDDTGLDTPAFPTLTGDNAMAGATMPFSVSIEGTSYSTVTIGTNGLMQFGTTTGANPSTNASLPSSSFPNPTLFWYWDDLQTSSPGDIRYGTVGTSPNRTFIVDFQGNTVSGTNPVNMQVQVHEKSNLLNVKYRHPTNATANGQSATIGFQRAGGASAAAYPLVFNGKILDDDRHETEGFSVHLLSNRAAVVHALMAFSPNDISGF